MTTLDKTQRRRAFHLRRCGYSHRLIAAALKVTTQDVAKTFAHRRGKPQQKPVSHHQNQWPSRWLPSEDAERPPVDRIVGTEAGRLISPSHQHEPDRFAERDRRINAALRLSLTAQVLGDPPPGYSALDKKRGEANP